MGASTQEGPMFGLVKGLQDAQRDKDAGREPNLTRSIKKTKGGGTPGNPAAAQPKAANVVAEQAPQNFIAAQIEAPLPLPVSPITNDVQTLEEPFDVELLDTGIPSDAEIAQFAGGLANNNDDDFGQI